jgi:hypothetical protein
MMGMDHVASPSRHRTRALRPLAAPLRALRRVPRSCAWLRLAGAAAGEQATAGCLVLLHHLPELLLAAGAEVIRHG